MKKLVLCFLFLSQNIQLFSQGLVNDKALITMSNALVCVTGDLTNEGELINKGVLNLRGDWQNSGQYEEEDGRVILSGFNDQTVYADNMSFGDLTIAGTGDKTLAFNATLSGVLDFVSGRLKVEDDSLIMSQELELYGINDQSYIVGRVFRSGVGELNFPIGTSSKYLPVTLIEVDGNNPLIAMEAFDTAPSQESEDNLKIAQDRYWVMTSDQNYLSGLISLPYDDEISVLDTTNIVVAQALSDEEAFTSLGAEFLDWDFGSGGVVTSEEFANGRYFTIGYVGTGETLLPVRVINVLTPRQDGKHDFLRVENIELYHDNEVKIYNRQGGLVWNKRDYDNNDNVFRGTANVGSREDLPDGNYFYTIQNKGKNIASGFVFLKR